MFSAIRSLHRPTTPIARVTAALPDLPRLHRKRRRRVGAAAIVRAVAGLVAVLIERKRRRRASAAAIVRAVAGLVAVLVERKRRRRAGGGAIVKVVAGLAAVLIGTAAVILRDKLASIVRRGGAGEEQAPNGTLTPDASEAESSGPLRSRAPVARVRRGLTRLPHPGFPWHARSGRRASHLAEK
jgi:hypothetical protein